MRFTNRGSFLAIFCLSFVAGCSFYNVSGLHIENLFGDGTRSASEIQSVLGEPRNEHIFTRAMRAEALPEWQAWPRILLFAKANTPITGWREYEFRGPIYNEGVAQAAGMVDAMTLGLGEPWAHSQVAKHQEAEKTAVRRFKVWFTLDDKCVGYVKSFDSTIPLNQPITFGLTNGRYEDLVQFYQVFLGRQVIVEPEVLNMTKRFDCSFTNVSKVRALELLSEKLKTEAGISIYEFPDGMLHATTTPTK